MEPRRAFSLSLIGFALAGILILGAGYGSYNQMERLGSAADLVTHTLIVREKIATVLSLMKDAETGQRGWVITGEPEYLGPYRSAVKMLPQEIEQLRRLTRDNPAQQVNLMKLDALVHAKFAELEQTIQLREGGGFAAAAKVVQNNSGRAAMDSIRQLIDVMQGEENRLYSEHETASAQSFRRARIVNTTGLMTAFLLVAGAVLLLNSSNRERHAAHAAQQLMEGIAQVSREKENLLRVTLGSIGDGVIATDARGCVTIMNPVAQALTGWTEAGSFGRPLDEVFVILNERTRQPVENPATKVLREGKIVGMANHTVLIARDGREIPIDDSGAPIRAQSGEMLGVVLVFRDVTERRRNEAERMRLLEGEQSARAQAETANRAKDEFLATLSHELRTPLNAIFGWVRMLQIMDMDAENVRKGYAVIERNTRAQIQLIDDLLDISRIVRGEQRIQMRSVDLRSIAQAAVDTVRPTADAKGVRIETSWVDNPTAVSGDANRLQQVFWNLLTNAIRYSPKGGVVRVEIERLATEHEIRVTDSGSGIHAKDLPHVFDRFWQADSTSSRPHSGLGIGLALVRHLAEIHGGRVFVESGGEGQGATFRVRLPVRETSASDKVSAPIAPTPEHPLAGLRVLIVDDDADTRDLISLALGPTSADVMTCGTTSEALKMMDAWPVDVLVSDIGMPESSGYDLIKAVRASLLYPRLPAIALTAYATTEDQERALTAGFDQHLAKPVDPSTLARAIGNLCGRPS